MNTCMRQIGALARQTSGNVLILAGLGIFILVGVTGAGVDLGRQQLMRIKLQQATDAVAVAVAQMGDASPEQKQQAAQRYFTLNFPDNYLGVPRPPVSYSESGGVVDVQARIEVSPVFVGIIGIPTMSAGGSTKVGSATSRVTSDYDVVMVVDESGSTGAPAPGGGGTIMDVERSALSEMVNSILDDANANVRFGLIGYSGYIANAHGLTSNKAQALTYIQGLEIRCQNYDHWGMEAGLNMATGNWSAADIPPEQACLIRQNTSVPSSVTGRSDGRQLSPVKHVVFLTDGYIMVEPPPCGSGGGGGGCPNYPAFLASCEALKAAGVIVHTISFVSQTAGDSATLQQCASTNADGQPRYYYAPDGPTLRGILTNIGTQIRKIKVID